MYNAHLPIPHENFHGGGPPPKKNPTVLLYTTQYFPSEMKGCSK